MTNSDFTILHGIAIQSEQLDRWKKLLKTSVYNIVVAKCNEMNVHPTVKTGYDVFRGTTMDNFIQNLANEL